MMRRFMVLLLLLSLGLFMVGSQPVIAPLGEYTLRQGPFQGVVDERTAGSAFVNSSEVQASYDMETSGSLSFAFPYRPMKHIDNPVASPSESFEVHGMRDPSIIQNIDDGSPYSDGDGYYYIYYTALDVSDDWSIGLMRSLDFITWEKLGQVLTGGGIGEWDEGGVAAPGAILVDGTIYLFYNNNDNPAPPKAYIGYATAPVDTPAILTRYAGNPVLSPEPGWETDYVYDAHVIQDDSDMYWLFYSARAIAATAQIGRANSTDINTWTKDTVNNPIVTSPVAESAEAAEVFLVSSTWYMIYAEDDPDARLRCFSSADLASWSEIDESPIMQGDGTYEGLTAGHATVILNSAADVRFLYGTQAVGGEGTISYALPGSRQDFSGNENDGTLIGGKEVEGLFGVAIDFDGAYDFMSVDGLLTELASDTIGTIALWMYLDGDNEAQNAIITATRDADTVGTFLSIEVDTRNPNDWISAHLKVDGVDQWRFRTDADSIDSYIGQWIHLLLIQDGTVPELYIEGISQSLTWLVTTDRTKWMSAILTDATSDADTFNVGAFESNGGDFLFFNGKIEELIFTNTTYIESQIAFVATHTNYTFRFNSTPPSPITTGPTWIQGDGQTMGTAVNSSTASFTINVTSWEDGLGIRWDSYSNESIESIYNFTLNPSLVYNLIVNGTFQQSYTPNADGNISFNWTSWSSNSFFLELAIAIISSPIVNGIVETNYNYQVNTNKAADTWNLTQAPGWLSIDSNGLISGIPLYAGDYTIAVRANTTEESDTQTYILSILRPFWGSTEGVVFIIGLIILLVFIVLGIIISPAIWVMGGIVSFFLGFVAYDATLSVWIVPMFAFLGIALILGGALKTKEGL